MPSNKPAEDLLTKLDDKTLGIPINDEADTRIPKLTCGAADHGTEPIREGTGVVALLAKHDDWEVEATFCDDCSMRDPYADFDHDGPVAIVEGRAVPENDAGSSTTVYLADAYLWDLCEKTSN